MIKERIVEIRKVVCSRYCALYRISGRKESALMILVTDATRDPFSSETGKILNASLPLYCIAPLRNRGAVHGARGCGVRGGPGRTAAPERSFLSLDRTEETCKNVRIGRRDVCFSHYLMIYIVEKHIENLAGKNVALFSFSITHRKIIRAISFRPRILR